MAEYEGGNGSSYGHCHLPPVNVPIVPALLITNLWLRLFLVVAGNIMLTVVVAVIIVTVVLTTIVVGTPVIPTMITIIASVLMVPDTTIIISMSIVVPRVVVASGPVLVSHLGSC